MQSIILCLYRVCGLNWSFLGEGGTRGDRAGALPSGKARLYHHGQGLEGVLETYLWSLLF